MILGIIGDFEVIMLPNKKLDHFFLQLLQSLKSVKKCITPEL